MSIPNILTSEIIENWIRANLSERKLTAGEILDGVRGSWKREIREGKLRIGASTVSFLLLSLESQGVVMRAGTRDSLRRNAKGGGDLWTLGDGRSELTFSNGFQREVEASRDEILERASKGGWFSQEALLRGCSFSRHAANHALSLLVSEGIITTLRVRYPKATRHIYKYVDAIDEV